MAINDVTDLIQFSIRLARISLLRMPVQHSTSRKIVIADSVNFRYPYKLPGNLTTAQDANTGIILLT